MYEIYQPAEDSYLMQEVLKKEIPKLIKQNPDLKFLEIGSGSGIQIQTLINLGIKKQNIFAVDINKKSVEHCRKLGFNCVQSDLFEKVQEKYNIVIFNPPYLSEDKNEPKDSQLSTTGGKKGSEIINKFLKQAKNHLKENAKIFLITSSLTKSIKWGKWKRTLLGKRKLFFEEIYCWGLKI